MKATSNKRKTLRVMVTILLAAALALIPPQWYYNTLYGVFYLDDLAKTTALQFAQATRWIHMGGIAAVWLLNLIFFFVNESKGDFGSKLRSRTGLQNVLNFLLVVACVAAMVGYRYLLSAEVWIGVYLPNGTSSVARLWLPYYVYAGCALFLWRFCMDAAPATNCSVRWPLAKLIDNGIKSAESTR